MPMQIPPEIKDAAPGAIGALSAWRYTTGSFWARVSMTLGGASLAFFGGPPLIAWLGIPSGTSMVVGWLLGMFGMRIAEKVMGVIDAFDSAKAAEVIGDRLRKMFGG